MVDEAARKLRQISTPRHRDMVPTARKLPMLVAEMLDQLGEGFFAPASSDRWFVRSPAARPRRRESQHPSARGSGREVNEFRRALLEVTAPR